MRDLILVEAARERYRPNTAEEILAAAIQLRQAGYSDAMISSILKLDILAVRGMLGPDETR